MSHEIHYVNYYLIISVLCIIFSMILYSMIVLFMDALESDKTIINEFYYKPPRRMKKRKSV